MTRSQYRLILDLIRRAADAWAEGNDTRAHVWCERAWAYAGDADFLDLDADADR